MTIGTVSHRQRNQHSLDNPSPTYYLGNMLNKRTTLLLNQTDYDALQRIALKEDNTVSELIRFAVRETYDLKQTAEIDRRRENLQAIRRLTTQIKPQSFDYKQLVNDGRRV